MGLLFSDESSVDLRANQDAALYHRMGCKACPLRNELGRMEPTGAKNPLVYILGDAPTKKEINAGEHFTGDSGDFLRSLIPKKIQPFIRWNNVVRSKLFKVHKPERAEIESCRPSVALDLEQSKPQVVLGFGNAPLNWVSNFNGITMWRGRRMPVKVGSHVCWYYPMQHPAELLDQRRKDRNGDLLPSEEERMFRFDLARAFADTEAGLPFPEVHDANRAREGVEIIMAGGEEGVRLIREALLWASKQRDVGLDYETNCIRPYKAGAKILTAAVGTAKRSVAFPLNHREAQFTFEQHKTIWKLWLEFLRAKSRKFVHNLSFEMEWTALCSGDVSLIQNGYWEDSATQASVIDERKGKKTNTGGPFSLEFLVQQYFGFNLKKLSNVNRKAIDNEPLSTVLLYNGMDAKYHLLLGLEQEKVIKQEGLDYVYELSLRRISTVVQAQLRGVPVDQKEVARLKEKYEDRIGNTLHNISRVPIVKTFEKKAGRPYNPMSNPDTIEILYRMLKRPECLVVDKFSKKQKLSADEDILKQIEHPLAKLLMDLRHDNKRLSTYILPLDAGFKETVVYNDSLLHPNYNTYFAETGRLSADDPNVQNWPKRDEEAKETRRPIAVEYDDEIVLAFDYGQIQARIIAMFSKDKLFCKALWERYDIHQEWTERLAHAYPQRIGGRKMLTDKKAMKDFRTDIKNSWTFPLFFGAKLESAAGYLNIPVNVVRPHYNEFWKQFAGVKEWQEDVLKFYNENGYTECLTGRRRHGPMSVNTIFNSPVQGTESDIVMDGMCALYETKDPELQPELMIHDDLTFLRIKEKRAEIVAEKVLNILLDTSPFPWINVPITVELSSGRNWMPYDSKVNPEGLKEIGAFSSDEWWK